MLDAALQLWTDRGWSAVTLTGACAAAGLDPGGFREEFPADRDLLCEIFDVSSEERGAAALAAMTAAGDTGNRWRAAVESFVQCLDADPRHAVVLVDAIGSPELQARRRSSYRGFATVMASMSARSSVEPRAHRAAAHFCVGGLTELTLAWMDADTDVDRELVLEQASALFELVMAGY